MTHFEMRGLEAWVVAGIFLSVGGAVASDPPYIGVTSELPAVPAPPAGGVVACNGSLACVDGVIRDMTRRWRTLDRACDHDAAFALAYLMTTIAYRQAVSDPNYFNSNAFVNNEDRHFANSYFVAYDNWQRGAVDAVPKAWRVAFEAAENETVSGLGSLFLGMSAHINRDLPFVLYDIGLTAPDGSSRKPDHDRVNVILNGIGDAVIAETAARYDPTIADADVPGTQLDATVFNQNIQLWREAAWRNAERLRDAPAWGRPLVAWQIEEAAALEAVAIATALGYRPGESAAARNAYCARREPVPETCTPAGAEATVDLDADASWVEAWSEVTVAFTVCE